MFKNLKNKFHAFLTSRKIELTYHEVNELDEVLSTVQSEYIPQVEMYDQYSPVLKSISDNYQTPISKKRINQYSAAAIIYLKTKHPQEFPELKNLDPDLDQHGEKILYYLNK